MKFFVIFYGHLGYFTAMFYILWPPGNLVLIWYVFPKFWYSVSRKIWQPCRRVLKIGTWSQSYDCDLQGQRCKILRRHE
jgi:hypothetical protein